MNKYFLTPLWGTTTVLCVVNSAAAANLSATQVAQIAKQSTVRINSDGSPGSGVIIQKKNNTYTILTAGHVVKNRQTPYKITMADGESQTAKNIQVFANQVDLAVLEFTSSKNYPVPKLAKDSGQAGEGSVVYVSGFPVTATINQAIFNFTEGKVTANSSKPLKDGYSLVYSNSTLPGHSGGPVWNSQGEVIAIHGKGDVDTKLSTSAINPNIRVKTGFNLGIATNTFIQAAATVGLASFSPATAVVAKSTPVDDFLVSGLDKLNNSNFAQSIADFEQAIQANPKRSVAYLYRGTARSLATTQKSLTDKAAFAKARRAVENSPQLDFSVLLKRSFLADYQLALADFSQAARLNPKSTWALEGAANVYNDLGDYQQAIVVLDRAIKMKPTDNAYALRGFAKRYTADLTGALADYNAAINLAPQLSFYYGARAGVYEMQKKYQLAIQDYNQALQLRPDDTSSYYTNRGLAKSKLGDANGAIADLTQAINAQQSSVPKPLLYTTRGNLYVKKNNYKAAINDFTIALQANPRDVTTTYLRANAYFSLKQYDRALQDLAVANQLEPNFADAYLLRGAIYLDKNQGQLALKSLNQALALVAKTPGKEYVRSIALGNRGGAKYLLKDYAGALQDLNQAIAADQDLPRAFYYRGLLRVSQGQKAAAIKDLEMAAQLFKKYKSSEKYQLTQVKLRQLR
jgi:tetratricopeptide (TPR) repeat protein/V8-like Glu-specific endopeptidase